MSAHSPANDRLLKSRLIEASGYKNLGMPAYADETLAELPARLQSHPAVMTERIGALLAAERWEGARQIAARLTDCMEEHPQHWIWWAYATRGAKSVEAAEAILEEALDQHSDVAMLHSNLACYAAVRGRIEAARRKLDHAAVLDPKVLEVAADDPDLQLLRGAGNPAE